MFEHLTPEQITAINDIQTAAKIFQETIQKHCPETTISQSTIYAVQYAFSNIVNPDKRDSTPSNVVVVNTAENPVPVTKLGF